MLRSWLTVLVLLLLTLPAHATINLRFDPVPTLIGALSGGIDFELNDSVTIGPRATLMSAQLGDYKFLGWGIGARFNYALNGKNFTNGWYWGPSIDYGYIKVERSSSIWGQLSGEVSGLSTSQLFGYSWFWNSFNMALGAGAQIAQGGKALEMKDANGIKREDFSNYFATIGISPKVEFTLGFKF